MSSKEATKLWRKNNPEKYAEIKRRDQRKKHYERWTIQNQFKYLLGQYKTRSALTPDDLQKIYDDQEGKCALSGVPLTWVHGQGRIQTNLSIDRIEAGGPYVAENVRLVCRIVNIMRQELTDEEFIWWCGQVVTQQKGH